jgi:hypothetical protein
VVARQPQLDVDVLVEQQLDVLQDEQLEHEQLELVAARSAAGSVSVSISNVAASSSRSSRPSGSGVVMGSPPLLAVVRAPSWHPQVGQPPPQPVLVLLEQQLDVLHDEQLEHEQLELHQSGES